MWCTAAQEKWMGEGMHSDVKLFCELHKDVLSAANIGFDEVAHALGLVSAKGEGSCLTCQLNIVLAAAV